MNNIFYNNKTKIMVFNFLNNEGKSDSKLNNDKNMFYENLNKDQKNNYELLTILSLIHQLISSDDEISPEELDVFNKLKNEISSKIIPDNGLSITQTIDNLNSYILKENNIGSVMRNLPIQQLEYFWENLISFAMVDDHLKKEEEKFIKEIVLKIHSEMDDTQAKKFVNSLLRKHLSSERFGFD